MKNKPKLIIFEGIDGAGKSTLAKEIGKILNLPIEHHGPVKNKEEGKKEYFDFLKKCNYSVIKDRFMMGEETYSIVYRGYKADYMEELENKLKQKFDVYLIFIDANKNLIEKRLKERGEDFLNLKDISKISKLCNEYYEKSSLNKIKIYGENKFDYKIQKILNFIYKKNKIMLDEYEWSV